VFQRSVKALEPEVQESIVTALVPFEQQLQLADAFCRSGLFGVRTRDQAIALMAICEAEGLHPAKAVQEYHIIQGRPALKADAMLARFQAAGGKVKWTSMTDQRVAGEFSHPQGGSVEIDWTIDMAKRAGLTKNPTWNQYPRAMLRARCISEGIRTVFPGVVVGTYTPEEVQDMDPAPQAPRAAPQPQQPTPEPQMVEEVAPPIDVEALIHKCTMTATIEGMELWRDEIRRVPKGPDRNRLMEAVKRRVEEIKQEMERERQAREEPAILEAEEGVI
jgi:hypothetical protein